MIELRSRHKHFSGSTIFSTKIVCGECGEFYGPKVWHSNDKYRRVIWQCNAKYKDRKKCRPPHLTEDEIKDAFVRAMNGLITEREKLPDTVTEFDEALWGSLAETMTIYGKEDIRFLLPCEFEIKA